jgi:hypothetical protein
MAIDAAQTAMENAIANGGVDPATGAAIMAAFGKGTDGKVNLLMCSRGASNTGAAIPLVQLFKLLANNKVTPPTGTRTGVQAMTRRTPGGDDRINEAQTEALSTEWAQSASGHRPYVMPSAAAAK